MAVQVEETNAFAADRLCATVSQVGAHLSQQAMAIMATDPDRLALALVQQYLHEHGYGRGEWLGLEM